MGGVVCLRFGGVGNVLDAQDVTGGAVFLRFAGRGVPEKHRLRTLTALAIRQTRPLKTSPIAGTLQAATRRKRGRRKEVAWRHRQWDRRSGAWQSHRMA